MYIYTDICTQHPHIFITIIVVAIIIIIIIIIIIQELLNRNDAPNSLQNEID